jgi:hypothetical protein
MSNKIPVNLAASVYQRLLNRSREAKEEFGVLLIRYVTERFLYRLGVSPHADRFALKGAALFSVWTAQPHRPTRDLDLLGFGQMPKEELGAILAGICAVPVQPDGLTFHPNSLELSEIRGEQESPGWRAKLLVTLQNARITVTIDVGLGDAVIPNSAEPYPTLLDFEAPRIRMYPMEFVIAEKLEAMVSLGIRNSRMKDFFDLWFLSQQFTFSGTALAEAISHTFTRRKTALPQGVPVALGSEFAERVKDIRLWETFLRRSGFEVGSYEFGIILDGLNGFVMPVISAVSRAEPFDFVWPPGGPWVQKERG